MKRLIAGVMLGALAVSAAHAQDEHGEEDERAVKIEELMVGPVGGGTFAVPPSYGRLVNVVVSSDIHYLYFEDGTGTIRVLQIGVRSASQRARSPLQLLTPNIMVLERGMKSAPETGT